MKNKFLAMSLLMTTPALFAQSSYKEVTEKLKKIDIELEKVKRYKAEGVSPDVLNRQSEILAEEKSKYEKLLKEVRKRDRRDEKKPVTTAPERTLPTVVKQDISRMKAYQNESLPIESRYELILTEISHIYEMNTKISDDPNAQTEAMVNLRNENKEKLRELQELKVNYEIMLRESEQNELAEMKKSGMRLGVMFDAYYQWGFNRPQRDTGLAKGGEIPYRNYTNRHNDLTLNLVELNVYKTFKRVDFYADIDFGEQPDQNNYASYDSDTNSSDTLTRHVGQAFMKYNFKSVSNMVLTVGKFYTHYGYETPKNIENRTYSRPFYYYLICPFWHEGVALTQSGIGNFGYGVYAYDATDRRVDNNKDKSYGFQLNYTSPKFLAAYNFLSGPESRQNGSASSEGSKKTVQEIILTYHATERLTFVADVVQGQNNRFDQDTNQPYKFLGFVGYADFKVTPSNSLNFRYENFRDQTNRNATNNLFTTTANPNVAPPTVDAFTLTNRYNLGNGSEIRLEYRVDKATRELFPEKNGGFRKSQNSVILGWLYSV